MAFAIFWSTAGFFSAGASAGAVATGGGSSSQPTARQTNAAAALARAAFGQSRATQLSWTRFVRLRRRATPVLYPTLSAAMTTPLPSLVYSATGWQLKQLALVGGPSPRLSKSCSVGVTFVIMNTAILSS
jgi:hypothetical protein